MPKDEPNRGGEPPTVPAPEGPRPAPARGWVFKLAAVALTVVSGLAGTGLARWLRRPEAPPPPASALKLPARLFQGWDKPDLALVLSAQQHGYLLPCGCSRPQFGGLERRHNLIQMLKGRGWPVFAADLGDLPQRQGPAALPNVQGLIKYRYSMAALKAMGYTAVGAGEYEAALDLFHVLGEWALNEPSPAVLAANVSNRAERFPGLADWKLATPEGAGIKVGVVSVVGPKVAGQIKAQDKAVQFTATTRVALDGALKEMGEKQVDLPVLLYHGLSQDAQGKPGEAYYCAEAYPQFRVVLCLSEAEEPPATPRVVTNPQSGAKSLLLSLGHKGRYVGVVGVYRTGKPDEPFLFRYQLVELGEEYATPEGEEKGHPVLELMEAYTRELKANNYLARYGQSKHALQAMEPVTVPPGGRELKGPETPTYVGSEKCKRCHESAYEVWKKSAHSHAYQTLVDARRPALRQHDGECIVCHVTGFGYQGGFTDAERTPQLENVGCESCHGPSSVHVNNPSNPEWRARLNPWKAPEQETPREKAKRLDRLDQFCQRCHDIDNDVHWTHGGLEKKWPKIDHPTVPRE